MAIFFVAVENKFCDQEFLFEADDFISATMKAADLIAELDKKAAEKTGATDLQPTTIKTIHDTGALWADEEGLEKFLENVVVIHQEEED